MKTIPFAEDIQPLLSLYHKGLPAGARTGWPSVDKHYTVGPAQFTVITGIPNHGKSEWVDALLVNLVNQPLDGKPWTFLICSPENWPLEGHQAKLLEKMVGKRFGAGRGERMTEQEIRSSVEAVMRKRFTFAELEETETFPDLLVSVREFCLAHPKHQVGIVLDPWNQLEHCRPTHLTETEYISEALSAAVRITRKTGAHLWIVAHPQKLLKDRDGKRPIPTPYDISGSAHWFNKADNCITVWRNPAAQPGDRDYGRMQIHVQKVRFKHIGRPGLLELAYDIHTGRYGEPAGARELKAAAAGELVEF